MPNRRAVTDLFLEPGFLVRLPGQPRLGPGPSANGRRPQESPSTFEHAGKQTIDVRPGAALGLRRPRPARVAGFMRKQHRHPIHRRALWPTSWRPPRRKSCPCGAASSSSSTSPTPVPMTEADQSAEAVILERLAAAFPGHSGDFRGRRGREFGTPSAIGPRFFLVDPLDGTKAFCRGDEHFTVNIGLVAGWRPRWLGPCPHAGAGAHLVHRPRTGASCAEPFGPGRPSRCPRASPGHQESSLALISHTMKPSRRWRRSKGAVRLRPTPRRWITRSSCASWPRARADLYARTTGPTMEWDIAAGHAVLARRRRQRAPAGRDAVPSTARLRSGLQERLVRGARG